MPSTLNVAKKVFKRKLEQFKRGDRNKKQKKLDEEQLFNGEDSSILKQDEENGQECKNVQEQAKENVEEKVNTIESTFVYFFINSLEHRF